MADEPVAKKSFFRRTIEGTIAAAQGRHTLFAGSFFIVGNVMHWFHRLDGTYIAFMGTLMGFVLGHSVKEDYFGANPK